MDCSAPEGMATNWALTRSSRLLAFRWIVEQAKINTLLVEVLALVVFKIVS